jgi:hypothetical protein
MTGPATCVPTKTSATGRNLQLTKDNIVQGKKGRPSPLLRCLRAGLHNGTACLKNITTFNSRRELRNGKLQLTLRLLVPRPKLHRREDWNIRMARLDNRSWTL